MLPLSIGYNKTEENRTRVPYAASTEVSDPNRGTSSDNHSSYRPTRPHSVTSRGIARQDFYDYYNFYSGDESFQQDQYLPRLHVIVVSSVGAIGLLIIIGFLLCMFAGKHESWRDVLTTCRSVEEDPVPSDDGLELGLRAKFFHDHSKEKPKSGIRPNFPSFMNMDVNYYNPELSPEVHPFTSDLSTALDGVMTYGEAVTAQAQLEIPPLSEDETTSLHSDNQSRADNTSASGESFYSMTHENYNRTYYSERSNGKNRDTNQSNNEQDNPICLFRTGGVTTLGRL